MPVIFWDPVKRGYEGETYAANPADTAWIGEDQLPGIVEVNATAEKEVDMRKRRGANGASIVFTGYKPARVTFAVHVWTPEQWDSLNRIIKKIWPAPRGTPTESTKERRSLDSKAVDVVAWALFPLRIKSVCVSSVTAPRPSSRIKGGYMLTITAMEWFPPQKTKHVRKVKKSVRSKPPPVAPEFVAANGQTVPLQSENRTQSLPSDDPQYTSPNFTPSS